MKLLNSGVGDTEKWFNLGENLKFDIIHHKSGTETSADLLKLTFKVKDTAEVGTKAEVTVSDITLDSDASENSTKEMGTKEIEISIVEKASNNDQGDNTTDNNNKEDVDDNNKDDVNNNKDNADDNKGSATNSKGNTSTEQLNLKGDNTKAEKQLPKTGVYNIIGIILLILASAIIFYNKYNKYKKV